MLFPEQSQKKYHSTESIEEKFTGFKADLIEILSSMSKPIPDSPERIADQFLNKIPSVYHMLNSDMQAILEGDPAATCEFEVIRAYPGFYAISFYRLAHQLFLLGVPVIPRVITEFAHGRTGIDIHPGASIEPHFFIDHGTGIVIGETCVIGKNVKIYQGVTLGALSVAKDMAKTKRHPTIEDDVVIYAGATILGGETIIGEGSIVGGNVWLTKSIPAGTRVYHQAQVKVQQPDA
ncbi:MAG: serine acetyltransferase [Saprospiraceae bacterium]|nr:serine acetyltransferase [Saprospiraceae bacterium]